MPQADSGAKARNVHKGDVMRLEGASQLRLSGAVNVVAGALEIADCAPGNLGPLGEVALRPVEQPAGGATERRREICRILIL